MMNPEEEPKEDSRFVRRAVKRSMRKWDAKHSPTTALEGRITALKTRLDQTLGSLTEAYQRNNGNLAAFVYQEEPVIFPYLEARYEIPQLFEEIYWVYVGQYEDRATVRQLERVFSERDIFAHRAGESWLFSGASLADIEQMPLNGGLAIQDIGRINRIFHQGPFAQEKDGLVQWAAVTLAIQSLARPEAKIKIPDQAKPLQDRLNAYWEYYLGQMREPSLVRGIDLLKDAKPKFLEALGVCIPALLGITPSSAVKLYLQRAMVSSLDTWELMDQTIQAIRIDNLPPDLERFQHFNLEVEGKVRARLESYYQHRGNDQTEAKPDMLVDRLGYYRKHLPAELDYAGSRRKRLKMPEGFPAPEVTVTSQYRDSLIFILHFNDTTHLTLDLGRDNRLYGLPPRWLHENPDLRSLLMADILHPFLAALKHKYPLAEPITPMRIIRREPAAGEIPAKRVRPTESLYSKRIREGQGFKRRLTPILQALAQPRSLKVGEKSKAQVIYSRAQVKELLGTGAPENTVDRVMEDIREFRHGRQRIKKIKESNVLWELRSGNHRIMLEALEGRSYRIAGIVDRKNLERFLAGYI